MQEFDITVNTTGDHPEQIEKLRVPEGTTFLKIAMDMQEKYKELYPDVIMLVLYNGKLRELNKKVNEDGSIAFVSVCDRDGKRTYRRSVTIMMQKAVDNLWGKDNVRVRVYYSLGNGYYCELKGTKCTQDKIKELDEEMVRLVQQDIPITKKSTKTDKAEEMFHDFGMKDKERLLHYRRSSRVNIYDLDGMKDYYYGFMAPSTGCLSAFKLEPYEEGFVLMFPDSVSGDVEPLVTSNKLFHTLKESRQWSRMLGFGTIGALNDAIASGKGEDIILTQEALMEDRIGALASLIAENRDKKFIMIAGPSSSGKTTFSHRLSIQLSAKGLIPHPVGLDDYYLNRIDTPKDASGRYDFECLEALDIEQFNRDMTALLAGEEVSMPTYNFKTGMREYRGNTLKLGPEDVLVIEGIHGLNDKLSYSLPAESKFRIYISALTQLDIDEHNPLPTTDARLIRRIVRDARTRGISAQSTIAMWDSVRSGEEKYIFPFQEGADVMFNSALVYELAVLKTYAEPLLFAIPRDCPEYLEAKRLLKFLDYFIPLPTEGIAQNSLIREFIGGSCFQV